MRNINEHFWSEQLGAYTDGDLDILVVAFGIADARKCDRIKESIISNAPRDGNCLGFYLLQAMARLGLEREAVDACRAGLGAPADFLPATVLGIVPASPASAEVVVQPMPGDLRWAKGGVRSQELGVRIRTSDARPNLSSLATKAEPSCLIPKNPDTSTIDTDGQGSQAVAVEWHAEPGHFRMDIEAAGGFIAALPISGFVNPRIEEFDLTPETPERRARKTYGWGNVVWRDGEERDPYIDWLATQHEPPPRGYSRKQRCSRRERYIWVSEPISTHVRYEVKECGEVRSNE